MELSISSENARLVARERFGESRALALISGGSRAPTEGMKFALTPCPDADALVYAVFAKGGRFVSAISARSDVVFPGGRSAKIGREIVLYVGSNPLTVSIERRRLSLKELATRRKAMLAAAAGIVVLISAWFGFRSIDRGAVPSPKRAPIETVSTRTAALSREVAAHVREGRRDQAKLAILEYMERNGEDRKARRMLESLDSNERAFTQAGSNDAEAVSEARRLYDEAMGFAGQGRVEEALLRLIRAEETISPIGVALPINGLIAEAKSDVSAKYKSKAGVKLKRLEGVLERIGRLEAREAALELAEAWKECAKLAKLLENDGETGALVGRVRTALEGAAARWIASVKALENLSGCESAYGEYDEIARLISRSLPRLANEAARARDRCEGTS